MAGQYDVLITGGTVIDPANGVHGALDVALKDGVVAAIGRDLGEADSVIDASGCLVTPGLIDLHTHVYKDVSSFGIEADELCPRTGVTTSVDTGTAGWINYRGLERYVMAPSSTRILAYVNLSGVGLPWRRGEMVYEGYVSASECAQTVLNHPKTALGVKVRLYKGVGGDADVRDLLQIALEAANRCEKPLMVHISNADVLLRDLIQPLRPGDIVTHCFHGTQPASIIDNRGKVISEAWDARDRGVIFDIGHGLGSFSYDVGRAAMEDGFPPDTISSDIHSYNIDGPVYDLPTTMSKFLNLGMSLEEVIRRSTIEPAQVIDRENDLGHLRIGAAGDVAVFELEKGKFELTDAMQQVLMGEQRLVCRASVRAGKIWWQR
ncbi:MAG: amidohydrolase/deacetylase family metallohydrolase [Gemmatimonadota bacterium]|nr:amidohydrolase/deacetylase family metallohydrolase [Gemmatimonadota bacterium]